MSKPFEFLTASIEPLVAADQERRQRDQTKLEHVVLYAPTALRRTRVPLEALAKRVELAQCGTCDNCQGQAVRWEAVAAGAA